MEIDPHQHIIEQLQAQPAQPQLVQPQPVPESWVTEVLTNGMVRVTIYSVSGTHVSFLPGEAAANSIGPSITAAGRQAKSGIIVVEGNGHMPGVDT